MPKVLPLEVSDDSVADGEWYSNHFEESFPPLHGLIPGLLGLGGIFWGWWNLRFERRLPLSGIIFLIGCVLWGYACLIILPLSIDGNF